MSNNITVLDGLGVEKVVKTTETAGVNVEHVNIDTGLPAGDQTIGSVRISDATSSAAATVTNDGQLMVLDTGVSGSLGQVGDSEWEGSGPGSAISILKSISTKTGTAVISASNAVIGRVGLQVAAADVGPSNPVPVSVRSIAAGTSAIGKVGLQVAAADVDSGNPVPTSDLSVRAAVGSIDNEAYDGTGDTTLVGGLKGIYAKLGAITLASGSNAIGRVGLQVAAADVGPSNPVPVTVIGAEGGAQDVSVVSDATAGDVSDDAYAGSGDATLVAIGKGTYALVAAGVALAAGTSVGIQVSGEAVSGENPVFTAQAPIASSSDASVALEAGTPVVLMDANPLRRSFYVFNNGADAVWLRWSSDVEASPPAESGVGSFQVPPGGGFGMESNARTDALSALCESAANVTAWESE